MTRYRRHFGASVLVASAVSVLATSEARAETKFELGMRTGYAVPLGKAAADASLDMSEAIAGQVPLWFELGARIADHVFVGPYFSYGLGILGGRLADQCDAAETAAEAAGMESSCSTTDMRLGAQVLYHVGSPREMHAWLGAGIGYEWWRLGQSISAGDQQATLSTTAHGIELLNIQLGGDFPVSERFALGPFFAFSLAQFGTVSGDCSGDCTGVSSSSNSIDDKSLHEWLFFGIRGTGFP